MVYQLCFFFSLKIYIFGVKHLKHFNRILNLEPVSGRLIERLQTAFEYG